MITQGAESSWKNVTSSVVQGSVLGPLCFSMYMNDLESRVSKKAIVSKFADDTKLIHPVATNEDIDEMQEDINHLTYKTGQKTGRCDITQISVESCILDFTTRDIHIVWETLILRKQQKRRTWESWSISI